VPRSNHEYTRIGAGIDYANTGLFDNVGVETIFLVWVNNLAMEEYGINLKRQFQECEDEIYIYLVRL